MRPVTTKMYKVTMYIVDTDMNYGQKSDVVEVVNNRLGDVSSITTDVVDIGIWHDDHPLNKRGADYEAYFKGENARWIK